MGRLISCLEPDVIRMCNAHIEACRRAGITLLVYCTRRSEKEQALEYARGRRFDQLPDDVAKRIGAEIRHWKGTGASSGPGSIVTNCYGPQCPHVLGIAYDCVPTDGGQAMWNNEELWQQVGKLGEGAGLEWGGRWEHFPDRPHFQKRRP
jgi:peptidoglycan LD-endopeptidase CwlK